jgi:hypothetical protein
MPRWLGQNGWLPQSTGTGFGTGHPHFSFELPLAGRSEDDVLRGMNLVARANAAMPEELWAALGERGLVSG